MNTPADSQLEYLRVPPHSIEAEQSVLGGLLLDNAAWDRIADVLVEEDFYRHDHRLIWHHIARLIGLARPADVITVHESLVSAGKAEDAGGLAYLNALAHNTPSAANIRRYGEIVRERAMLRKLVAIADEISAAAMSPQGKEARQLLDEAESKVFQIAQEGARGAAGFQEIQPLLTQVVERIDELYHRESTSDVTGVPTGFTDLDKMTSGMQGGDLIIVAGRPSMGKTSFSMNIGEHVAIEEGLPVAVFSMEMGAVQLAMRMLGSVGLLDQHRMRTGKLIAEDWPRVTHAVQLMQDAQVYIDESPALSPMEVRARAPVRPARPDHHRLPAAHVGQWLGRKPGHRSVGNQPLAQGPGQGTELPADRAVAAEPKPGTASQQAPRDERPARIRRYRTGRGRDPVHLPRRGLQPRFAGQGHRRDHHRQAA
jgi:replicative DNA helicase